MVEVVAPDAIADQRRYPMRALARKPMTVDDFLHAYDGVEGRWELVNGVPVMMAGGTIRHGRVARNLIFALTGRLRGSSCQPFGSDVGVRVDLYQLRYPDASVLCDPRDFDVDTLKEARFPSTLFEVLSPGTRDNDYAIKVREYKLLATVREIVIIDAEAETSDVYERVGDSDWHERRVERGSELTLATIGVTLTAKDLFRRD